MKNIRNVLKRIPYIMNIKEFFDNCSKFLKYVYASVMMGKRSLSLKILSNEETINLIKTKRMSVVRYGDGEFMYINGGKDIVDNRIIEMS